ncbi:MAG: hypothetical protein UR78_C0003G0032 [Candidatus Moranbacteria bacterium GW2011_GWF2_35_39]|nr:MAG: hypothetical protein UR78_C0003G0032 [Candidatus Moranbacteria bacterium GW2011_GWF2_35_39]
MFQVPEYVATCKKCKNEFPAYDENAIKCPGCGALLTPKPLKKDWPELRPEDDFKLY